MNLSDLNSAMRDAYQTFAYADARKIVDDLYGKHFHAAIMAEGFTPAQAAIIGSEAYEHGHSSGSQEIVCQAMNLCEFARSLLATKS